MVDKIFRNSCRYLLSLTVIFISGMWIPTYLLTQGHNLQKHFSALHSGSFQKHHLSEDSGFKMVLSLILKGAISKICVDCKGALELYFK